MTLYYQVNYTLTDVPEDAAYFHAQFRRVNPLPYKEVYTHRSTACKGEGHYVGTYMAWGVNNNGWWGEGEIKFFMDGDTDFPTIFGTGTEDYFCGSYNFENRETRQYQPFTTPYAGLSLVIRPDGVYQSQQRFSLYRWHIPDPDSLREGSASDDPGARLADWRPLSAAAGRHLVGGLLVSGRAPRRVPGASHKGSPRDPVTACPLHTRVRHPTSSSGAELGCRTRVRIAGSATDTELPGEKSRQCPGRCSRRLPPCSSFPRSPRRLDPKRQKRRRRRRRRRRPRNPPMRSGT